MIIIRLLIALLLLPSSPAAADVRFRDWNDPDAPKWAEEEAALPAFPKDENLVEFSVSAVASNRFFIDGASLAPGQDGVVRYTLVVRTAGGAINITREGMRCDTGEYKLYATGRADLSWADSRVIHWRPIENKPINRHHAALSREFFCPQGVPIANADEGREALRMGRNPRAP